LTDVLVGIGNRRAWEEARATAPKKHVAALDIDSLGWVNDTLGHAGGDQYLEAVGQALRDEGVEAYRTGGDEIMVQADDQQELRTALAMVRERLASIEVTAIKGDQRITKKGVGFSYGIGPDEKTADDRLYADKRSREDAGLRPPKGREPAGVVRRPAVEAGSHRGEAAAAKPRAEEVESEAPPAPVSDPEAVQQRAETLAPVEPPASVVSVTPKQVEATDTQQRRSPPIPMAEVARNHRVMQTTKDGTYAIVRKIGDRKRAIVKGGFATEKEAMTYLATHPVRNHRAQVRLPRAALARPHRAHRPRGKRKGHVTPSSSRRLRLPRWRIRQLEYGRRRSGRARTTPTTRCTTWRHARRPAQGLSLRGELAIAFGARGTGGKERGCGALRAGQAVVINLTKIKGAGIAGARVVPRARPLPRTR
jgi:diguanylate cyclase (GGDEF)-like protein